MRGLVGNSLGVRDFRKIVAWQRADELVRVVYQVAEGLPIAERFGLAAQMKRAAVSIASNIAEGAGRSSDPDFERFLSIAAGSASEVQYQLDLAKRLWPSIEGTDVALGLAHEVKRMLRSLQRASRANRA